MISYEDFIISSQYFAEIRRKCGDTWDVVDKEEKYKFYLVKRRFSLLPVTMKRKETIDNESESVLTYMEEELPEDPLCLNNSVTKTFVAELHIVYSVAYCVPVLYFNIWDQAGKLLSLEKVWDILASLSPEILRDKWGTITQSDHPIEGIPFFNFHPCNTSDVMKFITPTESSPEKERNIKYYIPNWLNIYGSSFGLSVSLEYFIT